MSVSYLGMRICTLRKQDNLTQSELASKLGVGKSTVSMWENGKRDPDYETLEMIADFFNVPISTFFPPNTHIEESELSSFELEVIKRLRRLTEEQQQAFLLILSGSDTQEP